MKPTGNPGPLVSVEWLLTGWHASADAEETPSGHGTTDSYQVPPTVLDVRWRLGRPTARNDYLAGHIPGAVFLDISDDHLTGPHVGTGGRHPLPDLGELQATLRRAGISDGDRVVIYDDGDSLAAARTWWTLRWAGMADVAVLDGGYAAWIAASGPVETRVPSPPPGDVTLVAGGLPVLDADGAAALAADGVLLDVRAPERYRGETEPIDPVAGHIPGARNAPKTDTTRPDGHLLPAAELRAHFEALGVRAEDPIGAYCGSGITAAHTVLALTVAGFPQPALYVGSWSDWITDPTRPVSVKRHAD